MNKITKKEKLNKGGEKVKKLAVFLSIMGLVLFVSNSAMAVHKGAGNIDCSGCHTMHNSQGNAGMGGSPTGKLLRGTNVENLCLSCHDTAGAQYSTYSSTVPAVKGTPTGAPASGNFSNLDAVNDAAGTANVGKGHNLGEGANSVTPAGGTTIPSGTGFTCTNCHDAHGTSSGTGSIASYRNLLLTPKGSTGTAPTVIRALPAEGTLSQQVYKIEANSFGTAGTGSSNVSQWCGSCHNNFYGLANQGSSSPYLRHPTDKSLGSLGGNYTGITEGSRYPAEDTATSTQANSGNTINKSAGNENNDQVLCLSCHKPHAAANADALRWAYAGSGQSSPTSGCQQCHNK